MNDPAAKAALEELKKAGFAWSRFHRGWLHKAKRLLITRKSWYNTLPEIWVYVEFPAVGTGVVEVLDFATSSSAARYALQRYEEVDDVSC